MDFIDRVEALERNQAFRDYPGLENWIKSLNMSMKRARDVYPVSYQAALKRRRVSQQRQLAARLNMIPARGPPRVYVARTPGGQITADNHYFDTERTITSVSANTTAWTGTEYDPNTTAMLCLFAPVIGDDISNRMGRKIFVKKIRINGILNVGVQAAQGAGDAPAVVRIILYQDKQTNGSQSQGEDVIASGAGSDAIDMFQNVANLGRFRVWKDKTFTLQNPNMGTDGVSTFATQGIARKFKMTIRPNCWVNFNATNGGTVADIVDNSFHLIANTPSAQLVPSLTYKVRTVFKP